jgi:hypothetical protein
MCGMLIVVDIQFYFILIKLDEQKIYIIFLIKYCLIFIWFKYR